MAAKWKRSVPEEGGYWCLLEGGVVLVGEVTFVGQQGVGFFDGMPVAARVNGRWSGPWPPPTVENLRVIEGDASEMFG